MLRMSLISSMLLFVFLISGCAIPQTPEEVRAAFNDGHQDRIISYKVKRSYKAIVNSLRNNTTRCLDKRVTYPGYWSGGIYYGGGYNDFKGNLTVGKKKTIFTFQMKPGGPILQEIPKDGYYLTVADIVSMGKKGSNITIYNGIMGENEVVLKAFQGWIKGRNGCPDLTKN